MSYQIHDFWKHVEVNDYKNGCEPASSVSYHITATFRGRSAQEVINDAAEFLGIRADGIEINAGGEAGRVDFSRLENGAGMAPTGEQLAKWKRGKEVLYYAVYTGYVEQVTPAKL